MGTRICLILKFENEIGILGAGRENSKKGLEYLN